MGVVIEVIGYGCKVVGPGVCDFSSRGSVYCAYREVGLKKWECKIVGSRYSVVG